MTGADLPTGRDPVTVLQAHVEDGDVGVERGDAADRFVLGARLADHHEVGLGLQQVAHAPTDDLVVVEEEDGDAIRHAVIVPARPTSASTPGERSP
jgi:hypothetical protein